MISPCMNDLDSTPEPRRDACLEQMCLASVQVVSNGVECSSALIEDNPSSSRCWQLDEALRRPG